MAFIESHQELARHPKTRKAARLLECSVPTVIGHLHLLWWWALDYAQDGDLAAYEPADVAEGALWDGDPARFVDALTTAGFLDPVDGQLCIHDWHDYAGRLVELRRKDAERKRAARGVS